MTSQQQVLQAHVKQQCQLRLWADFVAIFRRLQEIASCMATTRETQKKLTYSVLQALQKV